ncbi:MAG: hypothetical protein ABJC05_05180, partial [Pyrinomonadaceae bacterium]
MDRSLVLLEKLCPLLFCLLAISLFSFVPITSRAQTNRNSRAQPGSPTAKHTATLRAGDSSEGSRVSIYSDSTLDDYEAYRRGDRFYVKLPAVEVSPSQAKVHARGFEDVNLQKTGSTSLLSFHLQPGTTARVDQRGNRLEVIFTTPGGSQSAAPAASPGGATTSSSNEAVNSSTRSVPGSAPETAKSQSPPAANNADASSVSSASPSANSQNSTPSANPATSSQQHANDSWLGTGDWKTRLKFYGEMARLNWLPLVIGLFAVLLIVALLLSRRSRSRHRRDIVTLPKKLAKNEGAAVKAKPIGAAVATERISGIKSTSPAGTSSSQSESRERIATGPPPVSAGPVVHKRVDVALVQAEANSMLSGARYDNHVTGTVDSGAREVIATELLSALAGRNPERRERAR